MPRWIKRVRLVFLSLPISKVFRAVFSYALRQTPSSRMSPCNYTQEDLHFTTAPNARWKTCKTQPCNCLLALKEEERKSKRERDIGRGEAQYSCVSCLLCFSSLGFFSPPLPLWQSQWLQPIGASLFPQCHCFQDRCVNCCANAAVQPSRFMGPDLCTLHHCITVSYIHAHPFIKNVGGHCHIQWDTNTPVSNTQWIKSTTKGPST